MECWKIITGPTTAGAKVSEILTAQAVSAGYIGPTPGRDSDFSPAIEKPSPHTYARNGDRRRGWLYRYYVTREAIADGYNACPVTSVPASDVEGAVLDHVQKLLAGPEVVARAWAAAKRESEDEITEHEVTLLLADFATVWNELFPAEQARIVQLLVERVDLQQDALEVRIRAQGLASLVGELRQDARRIAA